MEPACGGSHAPFAPGVVEGKLGFDAIKKLGECPLTESGEIHFLAENLPKCVAIKIDEPDFGAAFDQRKKVRTASWKWTGGQTPERLKI